MAAVNDRVIYVETAGPSGNAYYCKVTAVYANDVVDVVRTNPPEINPTFTHTNVAHDARCVAGRWLTETEFSALDSQPHLS
jgi:hypothetical protein